VAVEEEEEEEEEAISWAIDIEDKLDGEEDTVDGGYELGMRSRG